MTDRTASIAEFYRRNPHMVTSPFTSNFGVSFLSPTLFQWLIGPLKGMRVLDLGCGSGVIGEVVCALGAAEYVGVDIVSDSFQAGDRRSIIQGDLHDLRSCGLVGQFDCAFLLDVFEHLHDPQLVLTQAHDYLRDGGILFTSAPNYLNSAGIMKALLETLRVYRRQTWAPFGGWQPQEHEAFVTSVMQRHVLRKSGFVIASHVGMDVVSGLLPVFYGKEDVWLRGRARALYEALNSWTFRHGQGVARWISMFSVVVARKEQSCD